MVCDPTQSPEQYLDPKLAQLGTPNFPTSAIRDLSPGAPLMRVLCDERGVAQVMNPWPGSIPWVAGQSADRMEF